MKPFLKEEQTKKQFDQAEKARINADFSTSLALFKSLHKMHPEEELFIQRLALLTYKSAGETAEAVLKANAILSVLQPGSSYTLETSALSGAINKRLFEELKDPLYLDKAIWFYKRGFAIHKDYYNGVNVAYLYALKSLEKKDVFNAFADYGMASSMWKKVTQICEGIITDKNFDLRDDKEWIFQSLSQAYLGQEKMDKVIQLLPAIKEHSKGNFDLETFRGQNCKLIRIVETFKAKYMNAIQL
jgi:hypothetical protein